MVYIVFDKKSGGRGVPPLVNIIPVNGDFNQNERPLIDLAMQQLLDQLLKNLKKGKYILLLKTKFGLLI